MKRPLCRLENPMEALYMTRGKFNSILEERLLDGDKDNHHIISIDVPTSGFDLTGKFTTSGASDFWHEMVKGIRRFDLNEIKLKPREFTTAPKAKVIQQSDRRKLPTLPPLSNREVHNNRNCHWREVRPPHRLTIKARQRLNYRDIDDRCPHKRFKHYN